VDDKKLYIKKKKRREWSIGSPLLLGPETYFFLYYAFKKQNKWDCGRTFYEKLIIYIFKLFLYFYLF
jgi:hypothetical protein